MYIAIYLSPKSLKFPQALTVQARKKNLAKELTAYLNHFYLHY